MRRMVAITVDLIVLAELEAEKVLMKLLRRGKATMLSPDDRYTAAVRTRSATIKRLAVMNMDLTIFVSM